MTRISNIDWLKKRAKKIKKELGIPHHEALDLAAKNDGYVNWKHFLAAKEASMGGRNDK